MSLLQDGRKFLTTLTLMSVLTFATAVGVRAEESWATTPFQIAASITHNQIAQVNISLSERAKATTKNIEGKAQEMVGTITGDPKAEVEEKVKQAESQAHHAAENVGDRMSWQGKPKAVAKYVEGKVQEGTGNITGNPKAQAEGKEKQIEGKVRYKVEDVKDQVKRVLD